MPNTNNYINYIPYPQTAGIYFQFGGHFDFAHFLYFLAILHGDGHSH